MAKIEAIVFPLNLGTATELTVGTLGFDMNAKVCVINYTLANSELIYPTLENPTPARPNIMHKGAYTLSPEEFETWGNDNQYIVELIANKLGITLK